MEDVTRIDLSKEIEQWKSAIYGEEVRKANTDAFEKIQTTVNATVENVNEAAKAAEQAVTDINDSIDTVKQKANEAKESADDAARSEQTASTASNEAKAAQTAAEEAQRAAEEAKNETEHIAGFDGTALTVEAIDESGLLGGAGEKSNVQALLNAIAEKVVTELVTNTVLQNKLADYILKSQIVNNLLATEPGNPLDAMQGKVLADLIAQLNSEFQAGRASIERVIGGVTSKRITFPIPFSDTPAIIINGETGSPNSGIMAASDVSATGFTAYAFSENVAASMAFSWIAVKAK